jgi:uncharacterized protein (DUF885 family)
MVRQNKLLSLVMLVSILLAGCGIQPSIPPSASPSPTKLNSQSPPVTTSAGTQQVLSEPASGVPGLDFDAFVEDSYRRLLVCDPEVVLQLGLSQALGVPTDQLTDISDEYIHQTQDLETDILFQLEQYDRSTLTTEQQLTYDIYDWYLTDRVVGHQFMYDDYPVNPTVFSVHLSLLQFFTDLRPLTSLQEAQDYIACLQQVEAKFAQLVDGLQRREALGVMLPLFLVNWIIQDLNTIALSPASSTPYYAAFETKVNAITGLSDAQKQDLLAEAAAAVKESVIPAYQSLVSYFEHLSTVTTNDAGVWKFPDGNNYYTYLLKHYTTTSLTVDQIHQAGLQALESIHAEMRTIFGQLGYPQNESLPQLYARVATDGGSLYGDEIVRGYEQIIEHADQNIAAAFDLRPDIGVIVIGGPTGGYYTPPAIDGSRPGMFYAQDTGVQPKFSMPTLAYHEAIPGHHFQLAIAQQLELPSIRRNAEFTAFVEGWALYAERLVSELGFYNEDVYGDLGRLQAGAFRAARLVVDTGIHAMQWDFNKAVQYMVDNTGMPLNMLQGEVSRYISIPGQATAYYIGYTRIMELRQRAIDQLGDQFDLKEFHNLLLGNGGMPLDALDGLVDHYITNKLCGG